MADEKKGGQFSLFSLDGAEDIFSPEELAAGNDPDPAEKKASEEGPKAPAPRAPEEKQETRAPQNGGRKKRKGNAKSTGQTDDACGDDEGESCEPDGCEPEDEGEDAEPVDKRPAKKKGQGTQPPANVKPANSPQAWTYPFGIRYAAQLLTNLTGFVDGQVYTGKEIRDLLVQNNYIEFRDLEPEFRHSEATNTLVITIRGSVKGGR